MPPRAKVESMCVAIIFSPSSFFCSVSGAIDTILDRSAQAHGESITNKKGKLATKESNPV